MQSHPAQGHTSYPPDLCPIDPLGSHCYLATIPPTGGPPALELLESYSSHLPLGQVQPKCKLSNSSLVREDGCKSGCCRYGTLVEQEMNLR